MKPGAGVSGETRTALVDLQYPGDWEEATRTIISAGGEVIAFGPHVDAFLFKRARELGCHRVLAKSKFMNDLPAIMAKLSQHAT